MQAVKSCKKHFFQKLKIYKKARNPARVCWVGTWWLGLWWRKIHKAVAGIANDPRINIPVPRSITFDAVKERCQTAPFLIQ